MTAPDRRLGGAPAVSCRDEKTEGALRLIFVGLGAVLATVLLVIGLAIFSLFR